MFGSINTAMREEWSAQILFVICLDFAALRMLSFLQL